MDNLISRQAVLEMATTIQTDDFSGNETIDVVDVNDIKALPPVTLQPKEGHWIKEKSLHGWDGKSYQCSVCGRSIHIDPEVEDLTDYPYCHCGAIMTEEEKKK